MTVEAGYFKDPAEYPGVAHLLEHLLFMGTANYPHESEFSKFISDNSGCSNASTSGAFTKFYFSI